MKWSDKGGNEKPWTELDESKRQLTLLKIAWKEHKLESDGCEGIWWDGYYECGLKEETEKAWYAEKKRLLSEIERLELEVSRLKEQV